MQIHKLEPLEEELTPDQEDAELLNQLRNKPTKKVELWMDDLVFRPKIAPVKVRIKESYLELPGFVPARDGKGWVHAKSRKARRNKILSAQQKATQIPEVMQNAHIQTRTFRRRGNGCIKAGM